MNFDDFRKSYPFIAYGEEYATWCKRRKWPKDATKQIKAFLEEANHCRSVAKDVAAIITERDYHLNVLKEKTYDSTKDMEKGHA